MKRFFDHIETLRLHSDQLRSVIFFIHVPFFITRFGYYSPLAMVKFVGCRFFTTTCCLGRPKCKSSIHIQTNGSWFSKRIRCLQCYHSDEIVSMKIKTRGTSFAVDYSFEFTNSTQFKLFPFYWEQLWIPFNLASLTYLLFMDVRMQGQKTLFSSFRRSGKILLLFSE